MRSVACVLCALSTMLLAIALAAAAPAAQAGGARLDAGERAMMRSINGARAHHGLHRLRAERRLARAADVHTRHMLAANYFAHGAFTQRVRRFVGFQRIGETLAMVSHCDASRVVRMWLNSPGHRAVLLSSGFVRVGIGRRVGSLGSGRTCLVTADFASRR